MQLFFSCILIMIYTIVHFHEKNNHLFDFAEMFYSQ